MTSTNNTVAENPIAGDAATVNMFRLLSRALDQTARLIDQTKTQQATHPTPCRSWNVQELVEHVIDEVHQFARTTNGEGRDNSHKQVIEGSWSAAFMNSAASLCAAWQQPGAMERPVQLPFGEVPPMWTVGQQITELAVHSWDIATATGQSTDLDVEVGRLALEWGHDNVRPEFRGEESDGYHIGPEVHIADDAPLYDRIAAFGGRVIA